MENCSNDQSLRSVALKVRSLGVTVAKKNRVQFKEQMSVVSHGLGRAIEDPMEKSTSRHSPSNTHHNKYLLERPSGFQKYVVLCIFEEHLKRNS